MFGLKKNGNKKKEDFSTQRLIQKMSEISGIKNDKAPASRYPGDGVQQIIKFLQANEKSIGVIVICAFAKPGEKIASMEKGDDDMNEGVVFCADRVFSDSEAEKKSTSIRTCAVQGVANEIAERILRKRTGLFG